jgi:putative transposase
MSQMLRDLRVTRSLGRPQVSKENPYSESQFKTLKYHPTFPDQFDSFEEAWES